MSWFWVLVAQFVGYLFAFCTTAGALVAAVVFVHDMAVRRRQDRIRDAQARVQAAYDAALAEAIPDLIPAQREAER